MSRAAQAVAAAVRDKKIEPRKTLTGGRTVSEDDPILDAEPDTSSVPAAEQNAEGDPQMPKTTKPKAPKKARKTAAKKAAAPAGKRQRRSKVISGALKSVSASGKTYLELVFEEGTMLLTPSSNREANRDIAVKAIRALLK